MYFPFLTCEVKCGAAALNIADRQNAHSIILIGRKKELNREILAFSISHNHSLVRIHGHYALIEEGKTTFYQHPINKFNFTTQDNKDKWISYKFTKSVYNKWIPTHLKRIYSVINTILSGVNFKVSERASFSIIQDYFSTPSIGRYRCPHGV